MMTNREENRRLRQEGHAAPPSSHLENTMTNTNTPSDYDDSRKSKRAKTTPGDSAYDAAGRLVKKKGDTSGTFLDPVQLGFVTEEQGRAMFDQYVQPGLSEYHEEELILGICAIRIRLYRSWTLFTIPGKGKSRQSAEN